MKLASNFRLSSRAQALLTTISQELKISKTDVVEQAIIELAERKKTIKNSLIKFSGALSENEADEMLKKIYSDRKSKKKELDL